MYRELVSTYGAERVLVSGESAGAGLAIALLQRARDEGLPQPTALLAQFPWTDLRDERVERHRGSKRDVLRLPDLHEFASLYAGDRDLREPGIVVGTRDLVYDDSRRIVARMEADGVDVQLDEWPDGPHGFSGLPVPEGREAQALMRALSSRTLRRRTPASPSRERAG